MDLLTHPASEHQLDCAPIRIYVRAAVKQEHKRERHTRKASFISRFVSSSFCMRSSLSFSFRSFNSFFFLASPLIVLTAVFNGSKTRQRSQQSRASSIRSKAISATAERKKAFDDWALNPRAFEQSLSTEPKFSARVRLSIEPES